MKKQKILLVGLYDTNMVSLAPQVLRAYAQKFPISNHFDIKTLELSIFSQTPTEHIKAINTENAKYIGFSTYIWNFSLVKEIVKHLDSKIILGGPQCNGCEQEILDENPAVDYVVSGEGEITFKELLEYFAGKRKTLNGILGVGSRDIKTKPRRLIEKLDEIPSPYPKIFKEHPDIEWVSYETSRGCPFKCGYCTWGFSRDMRYHSLERVIEDLTLILKQPNVKKLYFCDSSILYRKNRAMKILDFIHKNSDISVRYEFDAIHLDDDLIDCLSKFKNNEFNFGVQSTNPKALKVMNRNFNKEKFEENYFKLVKKIDSDSITIDLIYGLPGDNYGGYRNSIDYVLNFENVKWILTNPLILLPGSDFYKNKEIYGIKLRDKESYIVSHTNTFSKKDMQKAIKLSYLVCSVFLNNTLKNSIKKFSKLNGKSYADTIVDFFDSLPFKIINSEEYPYMIPSIRKDFRKRNLDLCKTMSYYPGIIKAFDKYSNHKFTEDLKDYEENFSDKYYHLKKFALREVKN